MKLSKREDIVVTKNDRAAAVLHGVTDKDLVDYLFESNSRFIARIESLRPEYQRYGGTTIKEVRNELRLPRMRRRARKWECERVRDLRYKWMLREMAWNEEKWPV